jgi:hypothetical protein
MSYLVEYGSDLHATSPLNFNSRRSSMTNFETDGQGGYPLESDISSSSFGIQSFPNS